MARLRPLGLPSKSDRRTNPDRVRPGRRLQPGLRCRKLGARRLEGLERQAAQRPDQPGRDDDVRGGERPVADRETDNGRVLRQLERGCWLIMRLHAQRTDRPPADNDQQAWTYRWVVNWPELRLPRYPFRIGALPSIASFR